MKATSAVLEKEDDGEEKTRHARLIAALVDVDGRVGFEKPNANVRGSHAVIDLPQGSSPSRSLLLIFLH